MFHVLFLALWVILQGFFILCLTLLKKKYQMIKICLMCNGEYESTSSIRNRRGRCVSCKNENNRNKYFIKKQEEGIDIFSFQRLLKEGKKKCSICKEVKTLNSFSKRGSDKYRTSCKVCDSIANAKYESEQRDKINLNRRNRRKSPTKSIIYSQRDRQRSLFRGKGIKKSYATSWIIREWLGCSVEDCKKYIEDMFRDGMNWGNRGIGLDKWQLDHKVPVSLTELDDNGEIIDNVFNRSIWHYTNLQPLWHHENAIKSNKYIL